jgi:hypothetical protein
MEATVVTYFVQFVVRAWQRDGLLFSPPVDRRSEALETHKHKDFCPFSMVTWPFRFLLFGFHRHDRFAIIGLGRIVWTSQSRSSAQRWAIPELQLLVTSVDLPLSSPTTTIANRGILPDHASDSRPNDGGEG